METAFTYRNRPITAADVTFIRGLIAEDSRAGRCALSRQLCLAWGWRQPNGQLKDMIARGLLLYLERQGAITLPPRKSMPYNPLSHRNPPESTGVDTTSIEGPLRELFPITFRQVRRTPLEKLCNSLIHQFHYLGYTQPVGEHLKYLVFSKDRPIACMALSSAVRHLGPRDRFLGWTPAIRQKNCHLLAYNTRFLILPWVRVPHLASHLLAQCTRRLSRDWQTLYHHPVFWVETFVDRERFQGTCYRAANWIFLGQTTGRGKWDHTYKPNRSRKDIFGYPLVHNFRDRLCYG
jgi:hypothetical protein